MIIKLSNTYRCFSTICSRYLGDISSFLLRLLLARVFIGSGLLKWSGWFDFDEGQYNLFLYEFFCPDPARAGALQLCNPQTLEYEEGSLTISLVQGFAMMAGVMEVLLPALLIAGLFTRIGAMGLLLMTLVIQLAVFPSWAHWWNPAAWWAVVALAILARGPGRFSLDYMLGLDRDGKV